MKTFKKILLWLAAIPLALIAAVVVVQTYYALTPVPLSKEAEELNARAAKLPTVTENGYRVHGLLAPKQQDPVAYGKCLVAMDKRRWDEEEARGSNAPSMDDQPAWDAYLKARSERLSELSQTCLAGGTPLAMPEALSNTRIKIGMPSESWRTLADATPDSTLIARASAGLADGPRRLGADIKSPISLMSSLMAFQKWRIASGVLAWESGDRMSAIGSWATDLGHWGASADGSLLESMLAVSAQTQILVAMQSQVSRLDRLDDSIAMPARVAILPVEKMSHAIAESMVWEWKLGSSTLATAAASPTLGAPFGGQRNFVQRATARVAALTFDGGDTLSRLAETNLWTQDALRKTAEGKAAPDMPLEWAAFGCTTEGDWGLLCLPFMRNPIGRSIVAIGVPQYASYGTRVADLRNLASATRLTIEARRRALSGEALAAFVANAPADMRDVFTGKPFEYDAAKKELRPVLREKNTVLGEKGPYALPL
jgi:hypothetical protein